MPSTKFRTLAVAALFSLAGATAALADRPPTLEERAAIQEVLIAEGFTSWEKIELDDDGLWEIDDAIHTDGMKYDLELDSNLAVVKRERD
ncbi:PepSY domain-containing protein [Methylobrevis albus]|uniref:PepSY domain-containing protein n=1 Tax=Methylobrevis albus TaxID=2793297 RepID=A0A931MYJ4_9HYPH|nr:PepSY domain-containing protein [Methylobrevis albus]MBH0237099.1 PepSY domain-containing protein [Methylobrevis albus]